MIHWMRKHKIRRLYKEGFSTEELAIMYDIRWALVKEIVRGVKR